MTQSCSIRAIAVLIATLGAAMAFCQRVGDLMVTPTRVNMDDNARSGSITVVNRSSKTVRYRLNLVDMEMSDDGILKRVPAGTANSATSFLRLSPREIVLEPGGSQRIRILAVVPSDLPDGEMRSHLSFEPLRKADDPSQRASDDGSNLKVNLDVRAVVTIPVIVDHGRVKATATIPSASLARDVTGWVAKVQIGREGNRTLRGDLTVSFLPSNGGKKVVLGQISSLPVYFPNSERSVRLPLNLDVRALGKGDIEFRFIEVDRGRGAASAKLVIPAPG